MSTNRELLRLSSIVDTKESLLEGMHSLSEIQEKEFDSVINKKLLVFNLPLFEKAFCKYFNENIHYNQIEIIMILLIEVGNGIIGSFFIGFNYSQVSKSMLISFIICKLVACFLEIITIFHKRIKIVDFLADYTLFLAIFLGSIGICHFYNLEEISELGKILGISQFGIGIQFIFAIHARSRKFIPCLITFLITYLSFAIESNVDIVMPESSFTGLIKIIGLFVYGCVGIIFMYNTHINKRRGFFFQYLLLIDLKNQKEILDNVPIPLVISNKKNISYFNSNASELIKIQASNLFEEKCNTITCYHKDEFKKSFLIDFLKKSLDEKNTSKIIIEIDSEERNMEITRIPIKYKGRNSVLSVLRDLTELLKEEKIKIQKKFELIIVGSMTHNFRTPLNCILATTEIVLNSIDETNINLKRYIHKINQQSMMLFDQVDTIHEYFNFKNEKLVRKEEAFNPKEVINSVIDLYNDEFEEKNIKVKIQIHDIIVFPFINDKSKYRQIMVSLISNSIKFTQNGKITISLDYLVQENILLTTIEDTGTGMSTNKLRQAQNSILKIDAIKIDDFKDFGLGIGISLSNSLCKVMGGKQLNIFSEENNGTKVCFGILNFAQSINPQYEIIEKKECNSNKIVSTDNKIKSSHFESVNSIKLIFKRQKLLFVDDVESNIFVLKAYAKKANIEFDIAHNGLEALEMYKKSTEKESEYNYSIIFMDINMPIMDGIEATKQIREYGKNLIEKVKIIGVTANMEATVETCLEAGMDLVKFKPFSNESFNEILCSYK